MEPRKFYSNMENVYRILVFACILQIVKLQAIPFDPRGFQGAFGPFRDGIVRHLNRMGLFHDGDLRGFPNHAGPHGFSRRNPNEIVRNGFSPRGGSLRQEDVNAFGHVVNSGPQNSRRDPNSFQSGRRQRFAHESGPNTDWTSMLHGIIDPGRTVRNRDIRSGSTREVPNSEFMRPGQSFESASQRDSVMRGNNPGRNIRDRTRENSNPRFNRANSQSDPTSRNFGTSVSRSGTPRSNLRVTSDSNSPSTSWSWSWQSGSLSDPTGPGWTFNSWGPHSADSSDSKPGNDATNNEEPTFETTHTPSLDFNVLHTTEAPHSGHFDHTPQPSSNEWTRRPDNGFGNVFTTSQHAFNTDGNSANAFRSHSSPNTVFSNSVPTSSTTHDSTTGNSASSWNRPTTSETSSVRTTAEPALSCTEEFQEKVGHTLCLKDDSRVRAVGVSPTNKLRITQLHNTLRAGVQPPAEDLLTLTWSDHLAAVAEKWAKQCTLGHDKERSIPTLGLSIGQNVAVGFNTWNEAIRQWFDEIRLYRYGYEPDSYLGPGGWREIAHFTQMVQNGTLLIGCGYAECERTVYTRYFVCNYAAGQSNLAYPYTAGTRCGRCPNNCNNGLCDCKGRICFNGGKLDPETCTCSCPRTYKGASCEILDCPAEDNWICGRDWPPSYCVTYHNVPEECPHMCGRCKGIHGSGSVSGMPWKNSTFTSSHGCVYTGKRSPPDECRSYGNGGDDMSMCESKGGQVDCGQCQRYFNIKRDYCPVMCGLCDAPCNGKRCSNGGTLDTLTCKCSCRPPFQGDTCELAACPVNGDPSFCRFWPQRYCQVYHNVPEDCPYKCGICKH